MYADGLPDSDLPDVHSKFHKNRSGRFVGRFIKIGRSVFGNKHRVTREFYIFDYKKCHKN